MLDVARLGLGALGILTSVTFEVEPLFTLEAHEEPMRWDEALGGFDELAADTPPLRDVLVPAHRPAADQAQQPHPRRPRAAVAGSARWFDDEFLSNRVFGWVNRLGNARPGLVPRINDLSAGALGERALQRRAAQGLHLAARGVVFREMEYAVPREVGLQALREVRALIERSDWRISFPVEIRVAPADDVPLSTAARPRLALPGLPHQRRRPTTRAYFGAVEDVLRGYDGRPHWGKLHTRTADDLAPAYPRWEEFLALRDRLDPDAAVRQRLPRPGARAPEGRDP